MSKLKSLEDLKKYREQAKNSTEVRKTNENMVIVGMGTCGIAAGAREVMNALLEELNKRSLKEITVTQTGCIGMCENEVLVDVKKQGEERITYGNVTPEDIPRIVNDHLINGKLVQDLVIGKPNQ
ncbi:(2Fe-2S) ferredoxin domain-containing protein [Natranaerobius thermophilus]|uniref:Ferredoxin-like protein n=1 Tax=Natranaerobius thermophilus (strain ATCC BAA-1301 / DSM 18059 / JW/NM-WN-LF) TaxID=457570 RepID=B2A3S1_NATTJ|nr:(2Fe-2S) ferredoxin domain-containing protein [Natranaerobius thermophilus]ACB83697.1 ferredoxin-like protein [Natranaerobius thermophilus JW/NM-WN-LF]